MKRESLSQLHTGVAGYTTPVLEEVPRLVTTTSAAQLLGGMAGNGSSRLRCA